MNNQTSGSGGASPEFQPTRDPASKDIIGLQPDAGASTSTTTAPVDTQKLGGAPGAIELNGVKNGHD